MCKHERERVVSIVINEEEDLFFSTTAPAELLKELSRLSGVIDEKVFDEFHATYFPWKTFIRENGYVLEPIERTDKVEEMYWLFDTSRVE